MLVSAPLSCNAYSVALYLIKLEYKIYQKSSWFEKRNNILFLLIKLRKSNKINGVISVYSTRLRQLTKGVNERRSAI